MNETQPAVVFEDIRIEVPWGFVVGRWYGNRKVRPILALHGWLDNLGTWDRLIPHLPQHIGILCIDLPGHGRSSKYPIGITYHVIDYVHIIIRIIKEYKWSKVSLMGHSMGAIVSFLYATLYPNMVDMVIQIDIIKARNHPLKFHMQALERRPDKLIIEDERLKQLHMREPPSHSYQELEDILYKGSRKSVHKEDTKCLLNRSINKSELYPEKFYFSRDSRLKFYVEAACEHGLALEMAKRIRNVAYMIVRSDKFSFMIDIDEEIVDILKTNNPHFEYHRLEGTHHLHMNNAEGVAAFISPFILRHRPMILDKWSLDDSLKGVNQVEIKSKL